MQEIIQQSVSLKDSSNYQWTDGSTGNVTLSWKINAKSVEVTWGSTTFTYNGKAQGPTASATSGVSGETINVTRTTETNVGTYTSTASISSVSGGRGKASNYTLTGNTKQFTIARAKTATASAANKTYNGATQTGVTGSQVTWSGTQSTIDAGTYTAKATPTSNYAWSDGTTGAKTITWTMNKKSVAVTWGSTTFTYNGKEQGPTASATSGVSGETINVTRTTATNAGTHTSTASISSVSGGRKNKNNYALTGNTKQFTIARAKTATASAANKTYNGATQTGVTGSQVTWSGTQSAIDAGTYTAKATPTSNYAWSDGTTGAKTITWTMNKKSVAVTWGSTTFTYNGKAQGPTASATSGVSGETIKVTRTTATNAGTHTSTASISSVSGGRENKNNYALTGNTKQFTIARAKTATASAANKTYNGATQTGVTGSQVTWNGTQSAIDAGTYTAKATPTSNYAWSDGTTGAKTITWTMNKKSVAVTWGSTTFTYNGKEQGPTASATSGVSGETINVTRTTATNAGTHTSTASISSVSGGRKNKNNYTLTGNTKQFTINKKAIQKTASNYSGNYDGSSHTIKLVVNEPTSGCTIYYSTSAELTSSNYSSSGSTSKPSRTSAGTTTVYWYIHTTNANYSDISGSNTITIKSVAPTISFGSNGGGFYQSAGTYYCSVCKTSSSSPHYHCPDGHSGLYNIFFNMYGNVA